jgi:hypothetical protein
MSTFTHSTSRRNYMDSVNYSRYTISSLRDDDTLDLWCDACGLVNAGGGHVRLSTFIKEVEGHERRVHG